MSCIASVCFAFYLDAAIGYHKVREAEAVKQTVTHHTEVTPFSRDYTRTVVTQRRTNEVGTAPNPLFRAEAGVVHKDSGIYLEVSHVSSASSGQDRGDDSVWLGKRWRFE